MGVRGLQTFMEHNCTDVASEVNIQDIVEKYRKETGRDAVIVVDGSSCLRPLYGNLDWICGGQNKEYVESIEHFIQKFQNLGIKLVFFFDGPTQARKRKVWVERRLKSLKDVYGAFDHIKRGGHPSNYGRAQNIVILPCGTSYSIAHAIKSSSGCEIHRTIKECDEEVAEYAMRHNCFAILGQDSDYVIYDGPAYYLSAIHLNVENMTTMKYNRYALARQLQLSTGLLPLFASLVGNDIIRPEDLLKFHKDISKPRKKTRWNDAQNDRPSPRNLMYRVSSFIRNCTDENRLFESLPMISKKVFGNERKASQLNLSVRSYSINAHSEESKSEQSSVPDQVSPEQRDWKQIKQYAEKRFVNGDLDSMIYAIMHGLPYEMSTGLEDFRQTVLPPAAALYLPLRQHIYGIILHEMPGGTETHMVEEWCMQGERSLDEASRVPVIPPTSGSHPGLMTLWNEEDLSEELLAKKWRLLANAVSSNLDPNKLKCVPATLLSPTLLLYFLNNEVPSSFMVPWEVDAFIATAVMHPTYTTSDLAEIFLNHAIPRAIQLASIVGRGASIIKMLLDACGRPVSQLEVSVFHYFDGKLFQKMYQMAQSGSTAITLCDHQVSPLEQFNLIRSIVLPSEK